MISEILHGVKSDFLSHVLLEEGMGRIHSVFENSFNIVLADNLIHVGKQSEGLSAFGLVLKDVQLDQLLHTLEVKMQVRNQAGKLTIYGHRKIWTLHVSNFDTVDLSVIESQQMLEKPEFISELLAEFEALNIPEKTGLFEEIENHTLIEAFKEPRLSDEILQKDFMRHFIGRGIGLTPSGDDLLMGIAMGCLLTGGDPDWLVFLNDQLKEIQTTAVSHAYYDTLLAGHTSSYFKAFLDALGQCDLTKWPSLINNISTYGHTSGWDTLFGIYLYFENIQKNK